MARHDARELRSTRTIERYCASGAPDEHERETVLALLGVLGRLRAAHGGADAMLPPMLVQEWLQHLHGVLIERLDRWIDATGSGLVPRGVVDRAKGGGKNKSVQNFETHVKSVRGEMGDEEPRKASLLDIAHWFYGEKRLEPSALRDQVRVALGLPPDPPLLAELFVFGVVRNVLAHRTEYEGRIAPRRIPAELALYVSLERRRVVVSPALVSLLDTFTSRLFAGASSSTEPAAAHGMEQLAGTLYRLEVQQRLSLPADVSAPTPMVVPEFARGRSSIGRSLGASALLITAGICALGLIGMAYRRADSSSRGVESSAGTRSSMLARLTAVSPSAASGDLPIFETPESVFDQWSRSARAHDAQGLGAVYVREAGGVSWHATSSLRSAEAIAATWQQHFANGAVAESTSATPTVTYERADQLAPYARACRQGTEPVARIARIGFPVRWFQPNPGRAVPCPNLQGPYVLRARQEAGSWRVCFEGFEFCDAICASCPQSPGCAERCAPGRR